MEVSAEDEVNQISVGRPHVVLLGAGASFAALPDGDKNGRVLPLMNNLIETLGLEDVIDRANVDRTSGNFEDIYAAIHKRPDLNDLRAEIESAVTSYFTSLRLPDEPTIYDHLVLSLRNKDFIATFNWDPLLVQALARNGHRFKLPRLLFLHGNVAVAYCPNGHIMGNIGGICSQCGASLIPTKLLYPVSQKNYEDDEFISRQWITVADVFKRACMVTIFGYGAPTSDASAIKLLKRAWGDVNERALEEVEIIDIRSEDDLCNAWSPFIHTHHYGVEKSFYDSWIANHPRRTGEAYCNQFLAAQFIENNPLPAKANWPELWDWFSRLQAVESTTST